MRQENSCIFPLNKCTIRAYGWSQFISFLLLYAFILHSYVNICIIQLLMKRKYQMPEPSSEKRNNAKLSIRQRKKLQLDFINQLGPMGHLLKTTLDICPDIFAWFADMEDRLMFVNRLNVQMCNLRSELDVLGKTCADLWPAHMATIYMGRCHQVRTTGQPIIDTVYDHASDYSTELRITHVLPLKTPNGEIIGTMTIYRRASSNESIPDWYGNMKKAVAYIDAHYAENISIADIARESGYSESQFRRIFGRVISKSPNNYITTIRLNAARKLLTTTKKSVTEIAAEVGFFDQSHFTRAFKRERGITPGQYRRQFWNE